MISKLKLGSGGSLATTIDFSHLTLPLSESCICHAFELASYTLARGPPGLA